MTESFHVSYEITPAALNDASRLYGATFLRRYRTLIGLISLAGLIIAVVVDLTFGLTMALFGILMLAMTWMEFLDRWLLGSRWRGYVGGTNEYVMDDAGIHYTNPVGSGLFGWSAFTTVRSTDKSIVLGRDRVLVAYVPVTAFESLADRDAFLAFARSHVGQASGSDA